MGGKTSTSSQSVQIPPEVLARYNSVNAQAQSVAQTPFQQYSSDPNAFVAPLTAAQNYGLQQTADYANAAQPGIQTAMGMTAAGAGAVNPGELDIGKYMNPYTQYVTQQQSNLMNQQFQQAQAGQLGNAIKSGAFGGDRSGIAAANLQQQQGLAYGNAMAPILQQGYNTALGTAQQQQGVDLAAQQANMQRLQAAGAQYGTLAQAGQNAGLAGAQAMMGAGQVQQQTQQAGLTALYNQFLQQQSYPFQVSQFLANIAEGTGALSGQTTTTTQPSSFFSDRRLKTDVKRIGTAKNGTPIHSFRYKDDPEGLVRLGFMADDVEKKHPEAVGLAGGYKTVDYDKAVRASGGSVQDWNQGDTYDRGGFDDGGLASPYNAWNLINQREAANLGHLSAATPGLDPYGGVQRHVPKIPSAPQHRMLQPGQMPPQQKSGLQQAAGLAQQGLGSYKDIKGMVGDAKEAYHDVTGTGGGSPPAKAAPAASSNESPPAASGSSPFHVNQPPAAAAPAAQDAPPPEKHSEVETPSTGTAMAFNDAPTEDPFTRGLGGLFSTATGCYGGRMERDMGGGLMSPMVTQPTSSQMAATAFRSGQDQMGGWHGPYEEGGRVSFDDGGLAAARAVTGPPVTTEAPHHGPDVVSPTAGYAQGLGEAQAAQVRANQVEDQINQRLANAGVSAAPDLTPFGQMLDRSALAGSMNTFGVANRYTDPAYSGSIFSQGGLAREGYGPGGAPESGASDSALQEYQQTDPDATTETTKLGIPEEKPNIQPLKPSEPPKQQSSGLGDALGAVGKIAGLIMPMLSPGGRVERDDGGKIFGFDPVEDAPSAGERIGRAGAARMAGLDGGDNEPVPVAPREAVALAPRRRQGLAAVEDADADVPLPPRRPEGLGAAESSAGAPLDDPLRAALAGTRAGQAEPLRGSVAEQMAPSNFPAEAPAGLVGKPSPYGALDQDAFKGKPSPYGALDQDAFKPVLADVPTPPRRPEGLGAAPPAAPPAAPTTAPEAVRSIMQPRSVKTVPVAPAADPSQPIRGGVAAMSYAPAQVSTDPVMGTTIPRNLNANSAATLNSYGNWKPPTVGQVFQRASEIARQHGIDPALFQRMIQMESGGLIDNIGDKDSNGRGSSFGVIQAHFGGMNPNMPHAGMGDDMRRAGIDVFDPSTWEKQLAFAANHIRQHGWGAWTTTMRKLGYNYASGGLVPQKKDA